MKQVSSQLLESSRVAEDSVVRSYAVFRWAVAFIVVVVLFIVVLEGWRIAQDYDSAFSAASDTSTNLTRAVAQQADDTVRQIDSLLAGVRERMEGDGIDTIDVDRLHRLFVEQIRIMPQLEGLSVFDEHGRRRISGYTQFTPSIDSVDRDYFIYHQSRADRGLHIGPAVISRITGEQVIPLSRRIDRPDGSFAGVLVGSIGTRYFSNYYEDFKLDSKGVFVLALRDGSVLVKHPLDDAVVGKSLAAGEVFQHRLPYGSEGVVQMTSLVDNQPRIFGYKASRDFPLVMEVGISTHSIIKEWRHDLINTAAIVLVMLLVIGVFSFFFLQQLRSKIEMAEALQVAHTAVQEMAMRDGLTGLGNRRLLDRHLEDEVSRAKRSGLPLSLIMLDIDFFKRFNDHYGHFEGDECLRRVASAIQGTLQRPGDVAVRYGGEEITVLLPDTDPAGARVFVERILEAIRALDIAHAGSEFGRVTASAGVFVNVGSATALTPEEMIRNADAQLYLAKQGGRDGWRLDTRR